LYKTRGHKDWAGGVTWSEHDARYGNGLGKNSSGMGAKYGAASFDHYSSDKQSAAKKSWFFLLNGIIALGAGCTGDSQTPLHTTIESRNLAIPQTQLIVDGYPMPIDINQTIVNPHWAHIENHAGYIFLDDQPKIFKREVRAGKWTDINHHEDYVDYNQTLQREYIHIVHDHGVDPKSSKYAYGLFPLMSPADTARIADSAPFQILANNVSVQAITYHSGCKEKVTYATFWRAGTIGIIRVKQASALIWGVSGGSCDGDKAGDEWVLSVSDPTHKRKMVEVEIRPSKTENVNVSRIIKVDQGVKVQGNLVYFNLQGGTSKSVVFGLKQHDEL